MLFVFFQIILITEIFEKCNTALVLGNS